MKSTENFADETPVDTVNPIGPVVRAVGICIAVLAAEPLLLAVLTCYFLLQPFEEGQVEGGCCLRFSSRRCSFA